MSALSKKQLKILSMEATTAFTRWEDLDLLDLPAEVASCKSKKARMDFWRHREVSKATQRVCSFKDLVQEEYLKVLVHFQTLAGNSDKAYNAALRGEVDAACHRAPGCEYVRDMNQWCADAGFSKGYITVLMRSKFKTSDITNLSERCLKQLHDTVVNRARAKLKKGDIANRNKKQTAQRGLQADIQVKETGFFTEAAPTPPAPAKPGRTYTLQPRPQRPEPGTNIPF